MFSPLFRLAKRWWRQILNDWQTLPMVRVLILLQALALGLSVSAMVFGALAQSTYMFPVISFIGWVILIAAEFERSLAREFFNNSHSNGAEESDERG